MGNALKSWVVLLSLLSAAGCAPKAEPTKISTDNRVTADERNAQRTLGDDAIRFQAFGADAVQDARRSGRIVSARDPRFKAQLQVLTTQRSRFTVPPHLSILAEPSTAPAGDSLVLGFPASQLGQQFVFGGVITSISAYKVAALGNLKLTDLPAVHVRALLTPADAAKPALLLVGCNRGCTEGSAQETIASFPILGLDQKAGTVLIDLTSVGRKLDLVTMIDPLGRSGVKTVSSEAKLFDYSDSTFVFDVLSHATPVNPDVPDMPADIELNVRWYLKLASAFDPAFVARPATEGVGYFMTDRAMESRITRFSTTQYGDTAPVHYFIKNVPAEYRAGFAAGFDGWNEQFRALIGRDLLRYEFLDEKDPRYELVVTGDVRYNVIEWDLKNQATYGGLGPNIAHQFTGEVMSANVLVQGPRIVQLYSDWYKAGTRAANLLAAGDAAGAEKVLLQFHRSMRHVIGGHSAHVAQTNRANGNKGELLAFRVPSYDPTLQDPMMTSNDFEDVPVGVTYEQYMFGYFRDLVAHELGHNLGLRHNFRGNLGATNPLVEGGTSRSIMEYLGRPYRFLDKIGPYDTMAIEYGYLGKKPAHLDWFCTDEDAVSSMFGQMQSAECSNGDATADPFSYFEMRILKGLDKLIGRGTTTSPVWVLKEMTDPMEAAVSGLSYYAMNAEISSSGWTAFFGKPGRPATAAEVPDFVIADFKRLLCDPAIETEIARKSTEEAKTMAREGWAALQQLASNTLISQGVGTPRLGLCDQERRVWETAPEESSKTFSF